RVRGQRGKQLPCRRGDLIHGEIERRLVGLRRAIQPTDLADELESRRLHLFVGGRRFEIVEYTYVAAHGVQDTRRPRTLTHPTAVTVAAGRSGGGSIPNATNEFGTPNLVVSGDQRRFMHLRGGDDESIGGVAMQPR